MFKSIKLVQATAKHDIVTQIVSELSDLDFAIVEQDIARPWGAYFHIDPASAKRFAAKFFSSLQPVVAQQLKQALPLTPKILALAPGQKTSWQYHHRRSEIWHVVAGTIAVVRNDTDQLPEKYEEMDIDTDIELKSGERHRIIGLHNWGIIAEIWLHTDASHPSDEDDIIRLADDYGRLAEDSKTKLQEIAS